MREFPDDESCLRWLWDVLYNLGDDRAHCARCGEVRQFKRYAAKQHRHAWTCTSCGLHVHPTAATIFHKSSTPLRLWFYAMYLMASTHCAISAKQLERELGVTYKTAWRMFKLIRGEMDHAGNGAPVEAPAVGLHELATAGVAGHGGGIPAESPLAARPHPPGGDTGADPHATSLTTALWAYVHAVQGDPATRELAERPLMTLLSEAIEAVG